MVALSRVYKITPYFLTIHLRPKRAMNVNMVSAHRSLKSDGVGLVVQGPIVNECDFTVETARLYKKIFPGLEIVVSTWDDENAQRVAKCGRRWLQVRQLAGRFDQRVHNHSPVLVYQ